jgi:hypothetical protein
MLQGPIGLSPAPRRGPVSPWTKQRTRILRRRWSQGARVREIAAELGHGIYPQRAPYWFRKGPLPAWVVNARPYVETVGVDARIPRRQRRSLFELSDDTCRWPVGDPRSSRFFFCGAQPVRNKPYCAAHCARAYRQPRESTRRVSTPRPRHAARDGDRFVIPSSETATLHRRSTGGRK